MTNVPFLRRVRLKNYKNFSDCDVELGRFTILVGRNGSGKSNFLDAIAFVSDAINASGAEAAEKRGGMRSILNRSASNRSNDIAFSFEFESGDGANAEYALEVTAQGDNPFISRECLVTADANGNRRVVFQTENSRFSGLTLSKFADDISAAIVIKALRDYRVYDPQPRAMRGRLPSNSTILADDGSNTASVFQRLPEQDRSRLVDFLSAAIDDIGALGIRSIANEEWPRFYFCREGDEIESFSNHEVSDGTLRAFAVLVAARQLKDDQPLALLAIEEPETRLHPGASAAIMEALREAALSSQILITTQSPDLLDCYERESDTLLVLQRDAHGTRIGPPDEASLSIIRDHLYSAGELLRMDQLAPAYESTGT